MKKLALLGGEKTREKPFPPFPVMDEKEINAVMAVLKNKAISKFHLGFRGGETVQEFEKKFAEYHGVKHAIAVNSGTASLHIAVAAAGVGPGDEVITTPYTFSASATSVLHHNGIPVFADINPKTFNLDPEKVREKITDSTKAIIAVHLYGHPVDMDPIMELAQEQDLKVIEDNAQSPGALYNNKLAGTIGDFGTFSFQQTKNIMTGEGGMTITDDDELAERARMVRNHGEYYLEGKPRAYVTNILGWNYRMTELEAAVGIEQLKRLDELNDIRIRNADFLTSELSKIEGIITPHVSEKAKHVYHMYQVIYDEERFKIPRNLIADAITAEGIPIWPGHRKPLYDNPLFLEKQTYGEEGCPFTCKFYKGNVDYEMGMCPVTEKTCNTAITLSHIRPPATLEDMQTIVDTFKKVMENIDELKNAPEKPEK